MNQVMMKARAKINLSLDVLGKREDNYHNIQMIMQTINLYDTIFIKKLRREEIKLVTNLKWLPIDDKNLAYAAAAAMKERYNIKEGIFIELKKRIPVAAGLAGGSSDAAAVLIGMRMLFRITAPTSELINIGKKLGSDVPYCILRRTALVEGIGDRLTRLPQFQDCYIVLAKPPVSVSTAIIYNNFDSSVIEHRPDTNLIIQAIKNKDLYTVANNMYNVLETVTAKEYPVVYELKNFLIEKGAIGAVMSGSGPTVFGIFDDRAKAKYAYYRLKLDKNIKDAFLTTIF